MTRPSALNKLNYFVGQWTVRGVIAPGPWGRGGKFSWTETTKWMLGRFFLVGKWKFKMPASLGGDGEELFVMGYDAARRFYTFDGFSSLGLHQVSRGTFRNHAASRSPTWTWISEGVQAGRPAQQRMAMKIRSATSYDLLFEVRTGSDAEAKAPEGWVLFMQGEAKKKIGKK